MTAKQFFDWQTAGGANDVMRLIDALEKADIAWCAIGGVAVNHWAREPMVTQNLDFVVATDSISTVVSALADTLRGKIKAWSDQNRRQSKQMKDLTDIARLVEAHAELWEKLPDDLQTRVNRPGDK